MNQILFLFFNNLLIFFMDNIYKLLMDYWLVYLMNMFLVDNRLVVLMYNRLVVLVDHILMYFSDDIFVDFMNDVLVVFLYNWLLHIFLDYGCLLMGNKFRFFLNKCYSRCFLVLYHNSLSIYSFHERSECTIFTRTVLKGVIASPAQQCLF